MFKPLALLIRQILHLILIYQRLVFVAAVNASLLIKIKIYGTTHFFWFGLRIKKLVGAHTTQNINA